MNSSIRPSPMHGASGAASSPVSRGERKRGRRKNFFVLLGLDKVVDVPVIFSDMFQQSKSYMFLKAPQLQFIDRVVDIPVFRAETCTHSANCAVQCGDPTGAVLRQCLRPALVVSASVRFPTFHEAHHLRVVSAIVSGLGMYIDFVDPGSSGKCSGTFLFTAPVAEPIVMSFTVPLVGSIIAATATVVTSFSSLSRCRVVVRMVLTILIWDSVMPVTGNSSYYFQYQGFVGCICMLNFWFSSNDEICADNYYYTRFKLTDICRSVKWELYLYGDMTIKVDRASVDVLPRGVPPPRFFIQLGNRSHTIYGLCLPSERGMGMSMPLAVPVSSRMFSGTSVSTA